VAKTVAKKQVEEGPDPTSPDVPTKPRLEGLGVPAGCSGRPPRLLEGDAPGQPVEAEDRLGEVGHRHRVHPWHVSGEPVPLPHDAREGLPRLVGGERLDPELPGERVHPVLGGPDPLPPDLDTFPSPMSWLRTRPPTLSRASRTTTERPAATRSRAASSPANPAPTMQTSASRVSVTGLPLSSPGDDDACKPSRERQRIWSSLTLVQASWRMAYWLGQADLGAVHTDRIGSLIRQDASISGPLSGNSSQVVAIC
jgi:hypothetical protein